MSLATRVDTRIAGDTLSTHTLLAMGHISIYLRCCFASHPFY